MKNIFRLLLMTALLSAHCAHADHSTYVFADAGSMSSNDFCTGMGGYSVTSCYYGQTAFRTGLGYSVSDEGLGFEVSYADFGKYPAQAVSNNGATTFNGQTSITAVMLPASYSFKIVKGVMLSAKLGLAFMQEQRSQTTTGAATINVSNSNTTGLYGIGVTAKMSEDMSVRLQYEIMNNLTASSFGNSVNELSLLSFGIAFGF